MSWKFLFKYPSPSRILEQADEDMTTSVLLIVALVLTICAVAFQIIGVAPPYWVSIDTASLKMHYGLWTTCTEVQTVTTCEDSDADEDWQKAVRAMSILGLLVLSVAVFMTVLKLFVMKDKKPVLFAGIGTSFAGGIFILIAVAVFAAKQNDELANVDFTYHFAFAFSIIAMITAFAAGGVMLFSMTKE
uniref:Uncharacterized protein n=1 Tax=Magallana gigas TaxID=29159 RepID=K1Q137_MAGGI